jgi:TPR repeat protein
MPFSISLNRIFSAVIVLFAFRLACFPQDSSNTYLSELGLDSSFLAAPNSELVVGDKSGKDVWMDTIYNEGVALYKRGQFVQAASAYKRACGGFANACTNLGFMYNNAQGVKLSHSLAAEYYRRGCENGNGLGCTNLGIMLWKAVLQKDDKLAAEMFERGCRNGDSGGCRGLGYMYEHGYGVPRDETRAAEEYKLADRLSHVHRVPIHVQDGLVLVSLNIQEQTALLIIDTGASRTTLARKYLPPGWSLRSLETVQTLLGSSHAIAVDVGWKLDGREIQLPALVGDFNFPHGAGGVLGADVLGMFTSVQFNYSDMVLVLVD